MYNMSNNTEYFTPVDFFYDYPIAYVLLVIFVVFVIFAFIASIIFRIYTILEELRTIKKNLEENITVSKDIRVLLTSIDDKLKNNNVR